MHFSCLCRLTQQLCDGCGPWACFRRQQEQLNNVAKFLEARGLPEQALSVATDPDYCFELAVRCSAS